MDDSLPTFAAYLKELFDLFVTPDDVIQERIGHILSDFTSGPIAQKHESWRQFFELLSSLPEPQNFAFQVGYRIPTTAFIPLAIPIRFAPTIRDLLWFSTRFYKLEAPLIYAIFHEEQDRSSLEIKFRIPVSREIETFAATTAFSMLDLEISHITGRKGNFQSIQLCHSVPGYSKYYKEYLGVIPNQNAKVNLGYITNEVLQKTNPFADPLTFKKYIDKYESRLKESRFTRSKSDQVREILMANISDPPSLIDIAKNLNLSERQLRFSLSKEGVNFRALLQECRIEYASNLLRIPNLPISQIAFKLGYKDVAAFNHGFKRWTGKSPSVFQADLLKNLD
jgi:AraC-like DNA-binding protein